jgi:hypothetical protein
MTINHGHRSTIGGGRNTPAQLMQLNLHKIPHEDTLFLQIAQMELENFNLGLSEKRFLEILIHRKVFHNPIYKKNANYYCK